MTEQQKFEAHMRHEFGWEDRDFRSESCGSYFDSHTAAAWQAWQARAAQDNSAELLALLEALTHSLERSDLLHDDQRQAFDNACAAISKARGE